MPAPAPARKITILLVHADRQNRSRLRAALRAQGYRVLAASNAIEALVVAARQNGSIDLLLTAVDIPAFDGRKLAEKLCQAFPTVAVLFLSAEPAEASLRRVIELVEPPRKPAALQGPSPVSVAVG